MTNEVLPREPTTRSPQLSIVDQLIQPGAKALVELGRCVTAIRHQHANQYLLAISLQIDIPVAPVLPRKALTPKKLPTEIDSLNGSVVEEGRKVGVACPAKEKIVAMMHQTEQGQLQRGIGGADLLNRLTAETLRALASNLPVTVTAPAPVYGVMQALHLHREFVKA